MFISSLLGFSETRGKQVIWKIQAALLFAYHLNLALFQKTPSKAKSRCMLEGKYFFSADLGALTKSVDRWQLMSVFTSLASGERELREQAIWGRGCYHLRGWDWDGDEEKIPSTTWFSLIINRGPKKVGQVAVLSRLRELPPSSDQSFSDVIA